MSRPDIRIDPYRLMYELMTEILEDAVSAQEGGDHAKAGALAEEASVIARAIEIMGTRARTTNRSES